LENKLLENKLAKIQLEVAALKKQVADKEEGCLHATQVRLPFRFTVSTSRIITLVAAVVV
jgi:hypothetical protein